MYQLQNLVEYLNNTSLEVELACFESFAAKVEPFLTYFQSDKPLASYLHRHLSLPEDIMKIFVRKEVFQIEKDVKEIGITPENNLIFVKNIDIPLAVQEAPKKGAIIRKILI